MAKKRLKKGTSSGPKANAISTQDKIRLDNYRNKMAGVWLAITLVWIAISALIVLKGSEILTRASQLDTAVLIVYAVITATFVTYRRHSRKAAISAPTFTQDMDNSLAKAKRFNNIELLKGTTTFGLMGVPILHFSGLLDPVFLYFGLTPSSVTSAAVQWLTSVVAFIASNALAGIIGGIAYDHFKRKPESTASQ